MWRTSRAPTARSPARSTRKRSAAQALNAGWGKPNSVREVVETICELSGADVEPDFQGTGNPDGEIDRQYLNSERIRELTGLGAEGRACARGSQRTIEWYREHPEARAPA